MAPRETEDNAYAKFWDDKQKVLWYVMVFSGVVNSTALHTTRLRCLFARAYGIGHTTELVRVLQCLLRVLREGLLTLTPIRHFFRARC